MGRNILAILTITLITSWTPAETIEKEFTVKPGNTLFIDIEIGGDVKVTGWEKEIASVIVTYHGTDCDDIDLNIEQRSDNIYVIAESEFSNWDNHCSMDFEIMVPDHFDMDLESKGGDFSITNITGNMEGETMGGDMEFVRLTGDLHFVTMGGDIDVRNSEVDGLVKTMGGTVTIRDVVGDLKGKTMGGNVVYKNVTSRDGGSIETSTMGGNIDIHSKNQSVSASTMGGNIDASGTEVDVSTMGGDIDVKEATMGADVHTMGGDIYIKSANVYVKAKTMGGDIEVDALDGWMKGTTMGGDIEVNMIGDPSVGERHVQLTSFGGDVVLVIPDGMDMEFDIELAFTRKSRHNYQIQSDYDLTIEESDEWERSFMFGEPRKKILGSGVVGKGTHLIKIKTTNGNITIKKS